jgi:hypothetical protein
MKFRLALMLMCVTVALSAALLFGGVQHAAHGQSPMVLTDTPRPPATATAIVIPTATPQPPGPTVTPGGPIVPTPEGGLPDPFVRLAGLNTCSAHNGIVEYVVGIGNQGGPAYNVEVVNAVSADVELMDITPTRGTVTRGPEPNTFLLMLGTLYTGESAVVTVRLRVLGGVGTAISALASVRTSTPGDDTLNNVRSVHCVTGNAPPAIFPTPGPLPTPAIIVPGEIVVIGVIDDPGSFSTILLPETGGDLGPSTASRRSDIPSLARDASLRAVRNE